MTLASSEMNSVLEFIDVAEVVQIEGGEASTCTAEFI